MSLCHPWATTDDLCSPCNDYSIDTYEMDTFLLEASEILYRLTGQQFGGTCPEAITPCLTQPSWPYILSTDLLKAIYHRQGMFPWFGCGCFGSDTCNCKRLPAIELPRYPITEITEVIVGGVPLTSSAYELRSGTLVRIDGGAWPCCDGTFEIRYNWGSPPPKSGVRAAGVLACELLLACDQDAIPGATCRLPRNISAISRQGVSVIFERLTRTRGPFRFGIWEIDVFLEAFAPDGPTPRSDVISPDTVNLGRRVP